MSFSTRTAVRLRISLLVLTLAAIAGVATLLAWPAPPDADAAGDVTMALNVTFPTGHCDDAGNPTKCTFPVGTQFKLAVVADNPPADGYTAFELIQLRFGDLSYEPAPSANEELVWPDDADAIRHVESDYLAYGAATGAGSAAPVSFYSGPLAEFSFTCSAPADTHSVTLAATAGTEADTAYYNTALSTTTYPKTIAPDVVDTLDFNCVNTPTFTPTATPAGPTATPTSTASPPPTPSGDPEMVVTSDLPNCDDPVEPTKCTANADSPFTISVLVKNPPADGYIGFSTRLYLNGLSYTTNLISQEIVWPDSYIPLRSLGLDPGGEVQHADATSLFAPFPTSHFSGEILRLEMSCIEGQVSDVVLSIEIPEPSIEPSTHFILTSLSVVAPVSIGEVNGIPAADHLQINCVEPAQPVGGLSLAPAVPAPSDDAGGHRASFILVAAGGSLAITTLAGCTWLLRRRLVHG